MSELEDTHYSFANIHMQMNSGPKTLAQFQEMFPITHSSGEN